MKRTIRERFPAVQYQHDMFTGVSGVYMVVEKEIPEDLYFRNRKGKIHYEGIKPKCIVGKLDTHIK